MNKQPYSYDEADKLHNFVRKMSYFKKLNNTALHIYFQGMYELEKKTTGLCQPTTASYREIAKYSNVSFQSIKKALDVLNGKLCDIDIGQPRKSEKIATRFRRYTIKELQDGNIYQKLKNERPLPALKLQEIMRTRELIYNGEIVKPLWSIAKTGRLYTSNPNVQNIPKGKRYACLAQGLKDGEVVFNIDYRKAEPSVLKHTMKFESESDQYDTLNDILGITRNEAKIKLNSLHYISIDPIKIVETWPSNAQHLFMPYAEALHNFREKLWIESKPEGKGQRAIKTLCGSIIIADRGNAPHKGKLVNWYAQGSVSDLLNQVCIDIIEEESSEGWRFLYPLHDAALVIGKPEQSNKLKEIFERIPQRYGLNMQVDCSVLQEK